MRRFMQTFVLAPQTPNKYYVHNDIFRYQDEVFHDESEDEDNPSEMPGMKSPVLCTIVGCPHIENVLHYHR